MTIKPFAFKTRDKNLIVDCEVLPYSMDKEYTISLTAFETFLAQNDKIGKLEIEDRYYETQRLEVSFDLYMEVLPEYDILEDLGEYFEAHPPIENKSIFI